MPWWRRALRFVGPVALEAIRDWWRRRRERKRGRKLRKLEGPEASRLKDEDT
jgi:hypothetical protein